MTFSPATQPISIVLEVTAEGRIDRLLLEQLHAQGYGALSRARLKLEFTNREILVDGRAVDASQRLLPGRYAVTIQGSLDQMTSLPQARISKNGAFLPVVHQDSELLVLNKLPGIPSVPHSADETETAVGAALAIDPDIATIGRGGLEPGLLHRLDTDTSGLLVFARTQDAFDRLQAAWKTPETRKIYRAIAAPLPGSTSFPTPSRTCRIRLGHDIRSAKRMRAVPENTHLASTQIRGKPLETITHIVISHVIKSASVPLSDFEVEIETGVMHQIRCTLAHLGSPILGDSLYGGTPSKRMWLHAWRIKLPLLNHWLECELPSGWPL